MHTGQHRCTNAEHGTVLDLHIAPQMHTRRNVHMIADPVVMIHRTPCVENHIRADSAAGVDNRAGTNHRSRAEGSIGRDNRAGMASSNEMLALLRKLIVETFARDIVTDGHYYCIVGQPRASSQPAQHRQTQYGCAVAGRVIVEQTYRSQRPPRGRQLQQDIRHNSPMSPRA